MGRIVIPSVTVLVDDIGLLKLSSPSQYGPSQCQDKRTLR